MSTTPPEDLRRRLEQIADHLIPEADGMPAASAVGVGRDQLDSVLRSRPDLAEPLMRALGEDIEPEPDAWMGRLKAADPEAHHALTIVVLAAYYASDEVKQRLDYPGQTASPVVVGFPEYVEEGLLDAVLERGAIYRETPPD